MEMGTGVGEHGEVMERKPATYADLEALPDNVVGELIGGVLYASPRPANPHMVTSSYLGARLVMAFAVGQGGPGGWFIFDEPELHLSGDVLVPDIGGWRRERMPEPPRGVGIQVAPDWVCEILSPSTEKLDRREKLPVYAREGVRHVWLIDPVLRTLEVYRLDGGGYTRLTTYAGSPRVRAEPFEAIELDLSSLWGEL